MGQRIVGGFEVETQLEAGSEHLLLLFAETQLIFARVAKIGRESMAASNLFGRLAHGLRRGKRAGSLLERVVSMSPAEILALDEGNFAVGFENVVDLRLSRGDYDRAKMVLVTRDMKVTMSASLNAVRGVRETIVEALGDKVSFDL